MKNFRWIGCGALVGLAWAFFACSETPKVAANPDAMGATSDADVAIDAAPVACESSSAVATSHGDFWAVFVTAADSNFPDELWGVRASSGVPSAPIKLSGTIVDNGRVDSSPGDSTLPFVWSTNGDWIAYRAKQDDAGKKEVYVVDMSTPTPGPSRKVNGFLPTGGNVHDYAFSPDSSKIAYIAEQNVDNVAELFVVDLGSGTQTSQKVNGTFTSLLSNVTSFRWSADSEHIAYVANEEDPEIIDLFVSNVSGAAPTARANLSNASPGQMVGTRYAWSPTSSTLAYSIFGGQLDLVSIDGGQATSTSSPLGSAPFTFEEWSRDGESILFFSQPGVRVLNMATGAAPVVLELSGPDRGEYSLAPDSDHVAINNRNDLYGGGTDGTPLVGPLGDGLVAHDYDWVADSSGLLFRAITSGGNLALHHATLDGSTRTLSGDFSEARIGDHVAPYASSPDSTRAVYLADQNVGGVFEAFMADLLCDTAPVQRVNADITPGLDTQEGDVFEAQWSPDGTMILYQAGQDVGDRPDLYLVNALGAELGAPVRVNPGLADTRGVRYFGWSP